MDFLIHHMLRASASHFFDREALVDKEIRLSYESVAKQVAGLAEGLRQAGLRRGDRVGIYFETSVTPSSVNLSVSPRRAASLFLSTVFSFRNRSLISPDDCQMRGLITTREKLDSLVSTLKGIPSLEFVVVNGDGAATEVRQPYMNWPTCLTRRFIKIGEIVAIGKDLAAILYTSGSTGKPKGVMLSHEQVMAGSSIVSDYLGITSSDRIIGVLPLSFDAGLNQLMTAIQQGAAYVPMTFTFAREIVKTLEREQITGMAGVPTLWSLMTQPSSTLQKHQLPHLRYITNTGGRMPQTILKSLRAALPNTRVFLMYGLTEAFRSTYLPPEELDRRPDSMGKAIPNTEILVVNEHGQPARPGEVGELVHRGPTVSMGYWGQPELTARVLRDHPFIPTECGDGERVCYSGDLVKMDEDGFLYFVGRRDNMIKSSGFRISPTEVEEVLFQSGMLREAAVIGIPDGTLGQVIKAYVSPRDGESVNPEALLSFCAERIPRYMVPKFVEVMDSLPKTPTGKIDYPALRRLE